MLRVVVCLVFLWSLTACSAESRNVTPTDYNQRADLYRLSASCNAQIEKKRWGTIAAMFTYRKQEPDHGFAKCMAARMN
jgi:hypothetical protein